MSSSVKSKTPAKARLTASVESQMVAVRMSNESGEA